jgi:hypothetical protein
MLPYLKKCINSTLPKNTNTLPSLKKSWNSPSRNAGTLSSRETKKNE